MHDDDRRNFLLTSRDLVVGALAAGTLACAARTGSPFVVNAQTMSSNVAAFGWEINNLGAGGGAVYLPVKNSVVLKTADVDMSFSPISLPPNPVSRTCCAAVRSRVVVLPRLQEQRLTSFRRPLLS
jgi:hypothetical protein